MEYRHLNVEKSEGIATVTINRPEVRNALNAETWREIRAVIRELAGDDDVKVAIFTGSGDKAFASGADINVLKQRTMVEALEGESQAILAELEDFSKPTIAAINGYCLGGGCELAMACDIRIAAESARLGQPEVNIGIIPGAGGTQRLARLVGLGKAKELILTGDIIDAQEALRIGLVNKVVPDDQLMAAARDMARKIMAKGPLAVRLAKTVVNVSLSTDLHTGLLLERISEALLFGTEDKLEGTSAFLEKRKPVFRGR